MERRSKGDIYWYIAMNVTATRFVVESHYDFGHSLENERYRMGNYFNTPEDAQARINILLKAINNN